MQSAGLITQRWRFESSACGKTDRHRCRAEVTRRVAFYFDQKGETRMRRKIEPLRKKENIERMKDYLLKHSAKSEKLRMRNYMMFLTGINAGPRVGDLCNLKVNNVTGWHIEFVDEKTGKITRRKMSKPLKRAMREYIEDRERDEYLFPSREGGHILPNTFYKILKKAAEELKIHNFATHSMRKTFGLSVYESTKDPALVMELLNHTNQQVTMIYIGKNQDSQDKAMTKWAGL